MYINFKYLSILMLAIFVACGSETESEIQDDVKYKSYKRIVPMLEADRKLIENRSDVDNAKRYIIKAFDNHEMNINKDSSSEE